MKKRRNLITPPLYWQRIKAEPVPPPAHPIKAERGGTQLQTPLPVVLVDTREQNPFQFGRFKEWFAGIEHKALKLGDYSVAGMEELCVVERKDLPDLVRSFTKDRAVFISRLRLMSHYPHRLLVITCSWSEVKSKYEFSYLSANQITQSLIATLTGLNVPFVCTDNHELGEELVASFLYQVFLRHWLETNGHGPFLQDDDL